MLTAVVKCDGCGREEKDPGGGAKEELPATHIIASYEGAGGVVFHACQDCVDADAKHLSQCRLRRFLTPDRPHDPFQQESLGLITARSGAAVNLARVLQ